MILHTSVAIPIMGVHKDILPSNKILITFNKAITSRSLINVWCRQEETTKNIISQLYVVLFKDKRASDS